MLRSYFKLPQKDISVPQVAVSSSFRCTVAKFFGYEQALLEKTGTGNNKDTESKVLVFLRETQEKCRTCS